MPKLGGGLRPQAAKAKAPAPKRPNVPTPRPMMGGLKPANPTGFGPMNPIHSVNGGKGFMAPKPGMKK